MESVGLRRPALLLLWPLLLWLCLGTVASLAADETILPTLDTAERAWLRAHPTLTVGVSDKGWAPFETVEKGEVGGLGHDYLREAAERLGVRLRFRFFPDWGGVMRALCAGEIDVAVNVSFTADRTRCVIYSDPYLDVPSVVVGRRDDARLLAPGGLAGLRVAVEKGFVTAAALAVRYPSVTVVEAADTRAALRSVATGEADAYVGNPYAVSRVLQAEGLGGVAIVRLSDLATNTLHFAVPNRNEPLVGALDKALRAIPAETRKAIRARWLPEQVPWAPLRYAWMSEADRAWLSALPPLRLGFAPDRAPVSYVDAEQRRHGISEEYLSMLEELGVRFRRIDAPTREAMQRELEQGRVDVYVGKAGEVREDDPRWVASRPFATIPFVIVSRAEASAVYGLRDLDGLRVGTFNAPAIAAQVRAQAPRARLARVASAEEGLERLREGDLDAYVDNLAVVDNLIRSKFPGDLRVAAPTGVDDTLVLVAKRDYARLIEVFDRILGDLSERDRQRIRDEWLSVEYASGVDWRRLLRVLVPIGLILLTAGFVHGVGHVRLRREVAQRRLAERHLAEVTDNLPAVVYRFEFGPDGKPSFPFIAGDMRSLFGIDVEQAMADERRLFARVHEEDRPRLLAEVERAARAFAPIEIEFRARAAGGWRWVRSRGMPHRAENGNPGWSGYWIDVTAAHEQAAALAEATRAAERAAAVKAEFLATMSHEIRTPMSGVLGMLERLGHTRLDAEQRRVLGTIDDSAQMLRQILDDILDYSKIEAGAMHLESAPVDLRAVADNVLTLVAPLAHGKGLRLRSRVAPRLAAELAGDGVRLRQVLFNLLSNAIKFTETGEVALRIEVLGERDGRQRLRLSVSDTGIGISRERQEKLFRPFSQAESWTARRYGGTGLGLSICRRLIDLMDGELRLHSELGRGTRVEAEVELAVLRPSRPDPRLAGGVARIGLRDAAVADALADWLQGLHLGLVAADAAPPADAIEFIDERDAVETPATVRTVLVTEDPLALVDGARERGLRLSCNPLLGSEVARACLRALDADGAPPREADEPAAGTALPAMDGYRVLVAEDHPTNQELIRWRLQQLGLACDIVDDGRAALAALERGGYDLLITDVRMPHMDGYELTREIRRRERDGAHLPVIALTAGALAEERRQCFEAGMDAYLTKPVRFQQLREAVQRWIPLGGAEPPADAAPGGVDMDKLQRVYGSQDMVRRMLESFAATTRKDLDSLQAAIDAGDAGRVRDCLHRIAGALRIFDANELADEAARLLDAVGTDGAAAQQQALQRFGGRMGAYIECLTAQAAS